MYKPAFFSTGSAMFAKMQSCLMYNLCDRGSHLLDRVDVQAVAHRLADSKLLR